MTSHCTGVRGLSHGHRSQAPRAHSVNGTPVGVGEGHDQVDVVVHSDRGTCVVHVDGAVDAHTLMQLERRCDAELTLGTTALVLDFTGMTACPSALFKVLSRIVTAFRRQACSVELVGLVAALTTIVTPAHPGAVYDCPTPGADMVIGDSEEPSPAQETR